MEPVVRQTCIDSDLIQQLKIEAGRRSVYLQDLYEEAFRLFLNKRSSLQGNWVYLASPRDGKELNIKMHPSVFAEIDRIAKEDKVSLRRVLFTALFTFAELLEEKN